MGLSLPNMFDPKKEERFSGFIPEIESIKKQLADVQEELRLERLKNKTIETGVAELRKVLGPLYQGLQHIHGEFDRMGIATATENVAPQKKAVWEDWKRKLDPQCGKAIDALLIHGEMNRAQLRLHVGCAAKSTAGIVFRLNKMNLIRKNGGRISLKEI